MPWIAEAVQAGFSPVEPWLPIPDSHRARAVDRQSADPRSMLASTRQLIRLRQAHPALRSGELEVAFADEALLHLVRRAGPSVVHAVFNLGTTPRGFAMPAADRRTAWTFGALTAADSLELPPGTAWYGLGEP
jgi:alpha-glucosidase